MPEITYTMEVDTARDGTYGTTIDDITAFVKGQIQFQYGMQASYDEVAAPARMTFTVTNAGGEFDREGYLSAELLANGGFDDWTGSYPNDVPVGWTTSENQVSNALVTQAAPYLGGPGGGNGVGACNLFTNGSVRPSISQSVFAPGKTYRVNIPITCNYTVDSSNGSITNVHVTGIRAFTTGDSPISGTFNVPGDHIFYFTPSIGQTIFKIMPASDSGTDDGGGNGFGDDCDITIDDVSVREVSLYRAVEKGTLCRLRATYMGTTTTLWEGKVTQMQFTPGLSSEPICTITCEDPMLQLLDKEFTPKLKTEVTADAVIEEMLDDGLVSYPYEHSYWLLGVEGASDLGINTYLFDNTVTNFETGVHTFTYVGDAADRGQGVNAQQYIRDLIATEVGRFWWDARNAQWAMVNRQHDTLNDVSNVVATFSDDDLDSVTVKYADDLINQLKVLYNLREIGGADSVIWSARNVPFLLKANSTRKINARYFDASDNTKQVSAKDFTQVVNGTDVVANTESGGGGINVSDKVTMWVDSGATGATIYVSNSYASDVYITTLQLRGTPLTQIEEEYEDLSGDSIRDYDRYPKTVELRLLDDADTALQYTTYQLARFRTPLNRLESITFNSLRNTKMTEAAINRVMSDRITVTLDSNGHDADYFIVGEQRSIAVGGDMPAQVTWILKPAQRELFWVLGVTGQSELGTTTILGF